MHHATARLVRIAAPVLGLLFVAACATQPDAVAGAPGFFRGVWHGFIAPIALIASIFTEHRIYAVPNNGGWYDFGFLLGVTLWAGGGCGAASRKGG